MTCAPGSKALWSGGSTMVQHAKLPLGVPTSHSAGPDSSPGYSTFSPRRQCTMIQGLGLASHMEDWRRFLVPGSGLVGIKLGD